MNRIHQIIKALSITGICICIVHIGLLLSLNACKKKQTTNTNDTPIVEEPIPIIDTAFEPFAKLSDFLPVGNTIISMVYHKESKNLYFYLKKGSNPGYAILQLNTETKNALIVFNSVDPNWLNSNGSEGKRIRIGGIARDELFIPGGATNNFIHRLSGLGTNTLSLINAIPMPSNSGSPYDIGINPGDNEMSVITMNNKIIRGNLTLSNAVTYNIGSTSHGASIVPVYNTLICSGGDPAAGVIELRVKVNGNFIRSVALPSAMFSSLQIDAQERLVLALKHKIYRYSHNLLTKEEFKAIGANDYTQIALENEGDKTRIYMCDNSYIRTMTIKN